METKLLPCPFCGKSYIDLTEFGGIWVVDCDWCDAGMACHYDTKEEAIEAWNTRAERTCRVIGSYYDELLDEVYTDLSCGHHVRGAAREFLFCPSCGAKVME